MHTSFILKNKNIVILTAQGFEDEEGWTNFDQESTNRKHILPSSDRVVNGGVTHLVVVLTNNDVKDIPEEVKRVPGKFLREFCL